MTTRNGLAHQLEGEKVQEEVKNVFACRRCGFCCHGETTVSLDEHDQKRMLEILQISRQEAMEKYWRGAGGQVQMRIKDGHCIFFDDGCSVHEGRPWRCRQWPLVDAILIDAATLDTIKASCPGLNSGVSYDSVCEEVRRRLWQRPRDTSTENNGEGDVP